MKQHFIFKLKERYLPEIIKEYIRNGIIKKSNYSINDLYYLEIKLLRRLKIQNIKDELSKDDKNALEFLINKDLVELISEEEYKKMIKSFTGSMGVTGSTGSTGVIGVSGMSGVSGVSGSSSVIQNWNKLGY